MFKHHRRIHSSVSVVAAALIQLIVVQAAAQANSDLAAISGYRLTQAGLARYTQAATSLGTLASTAARDCAVDGDDDDDGKSIDALAAKLDATPGAQAALTSAGISSREFVVFTFALMQAGMAAWALEQPGGTLPAGVSMDNVNFYREHRASLEQLGKQTGSASCNDTDDSGDDGHASG